MNYCLRCWVSWAAFFDTLCINQIWKLLPISLNKTISLTFSALALFEHVNLVYGTISEFCTTTGCADMTGPGNRWVALKHVSFISYTSLLKCLPFVSQTECTYGSMRRERRRGWLHHSTSTTWWRSRKRPSAMSQSFPPNTPTNFPAPSKV